MKKKSGFRKGVGQTVLRILVALFLALLLAGYGKAHAGQRGGTWSVQAGGNLALIGQEGLSAQDYLEGSGNLLKGVLTDMGTGLGKRSLVLQAVNQLSSSAMSPKEGGRRGAKATEEQRAGAKERFSDRLKRLGVRPSSPLVLFYRSLEDLGLLG